MDTYKRSFLHSYLVAVICSLGGVHLPEHYEDEIRDLMKNKAPEKPEHHYRVSIDKKFATNGNIVFYYREALVSPPSGIKSIVTKKSRHVDNDTIERIITQAREKCDPKIIEGMELAMRADFNELIIWLRNEGRHRYSQIVTKCMFPIKCKSVIEKIIDALIDWQCYGYGIKDFTKPF